MTLGWSKYQQEKQNQSNQLNKGLTTLEESLIVTEQDKQPCYHASFFL
jgi:hypothetical protein